MSIFVKSMIMLAAMHLSASDAAPMSTTHILVGATLCRSLSLSSDPLLRFKASAPGSRTLQAETDLKLGAASAGCTIQVPSTVVLEAAAGGPSVAVAVKLLPTASSKLVETQMEVPAGLPQGAYAGVMDMVVVYN